MFSMKAVKKVNELMDILSRVKTPKDSEFKFSIIARQESRWFRFLSRKVFSIIAQYDKGEGELTRSQLVIESSKGSVLKFKDNAETLIRELITGMTADRPVIKPEKVNSKEVFNRLTAHDEASDDNDLYDLLNHQSSELTILYQRIRGSHREEQQLTVPFNKVTYK